MTARDPHAVLGVPPGASEAEVIRAYRQYALAHHPDRGGRPEHFSVGQEAYRQLRRTGLRAADNVVFHRRPRGWRRVADRLGWRHSRTGGKRQ